MPESFPVRIYNLVRATGFLESSAGQNLLISAYTFYKRHFEDPFAALLEKYPELFTGGDIIDVGANVGYNTRLFVDALASSHYRVFAFEPEVRNAAILAHRFHREISTGKVELVRTALSSVEGMVGFAINERHFADHRVLLPGETGSSAGKVPAERFDAFCERRKVTDIAFVKIDVQGHELDVLKGMQVTLRERIRNGLALEIEQGSDETEEILVLLRDAGFSLSQITRNGELSPVSGSSDIRYPKRGYTDLLAVRPGVMRPGQN